MSRKMSLTANLSTMTTCRFEGVIILDKESVYFLNELQLLAETRKRLTDRTEINGLIADTAEKFLNRLDIETTADEREEKPVKSEMPCNCKQEKSLQSVIANVAKRIEEKSDNGKTFAAICKQEKTLQENIDKIIEKAIEEAAGELTDSKTFAAIVFRIDN